MTQDEAFIADIVAHPGEPGVRLIYADWLDDHDQPDRASFLRLQAELMHHRHDDKARAPLLAHLRELRPRLGTEWVSQLDRVRVELCQVKLDIQCPAEWEKMRPTEEPSVRFCDGCGKNVYYCTTIQEVRRHAGPRHCVAVDSSLERREWDTMVATPGVPSWWFFYPPGTLVRIKGGEHEGLRGVVLMLLAYPADEVDIRVRRGEGVETVRVSVRQIEACDGTPTWCVE